jgi:hypothetical protein
MSLVLPTLFSLSCLSVLCNISISYVREMEDSVGELASSRATLPGPAESGADVDVVMGKSGARTEGAEPIVIRYAGRICDAKELGAVGYG